MSSDDRTVYSASDKYSIHITTKCVLPMGVIGADLVRSRNRFIGWTVHLTETGLHHSLLNLYALNCDLQSV